MEENAILTNDSTALQELFGTRIKIQETYGELSICKSLLSAIRIDKFLDKIQSLSGSVKIKKAIPSENELDEPWTVYVYEIHVDGDCESISPIPMEFFGNKQSNKITRVIWIKSKAIRVKDAKLRVYKKYESHLTENKRILLHHAFDDHDEIFKLSGVQILDTLSEIISSTESAISLESKEIPAFLKNVAEEAWSQENIRKFSCEACLFDGSAEIGACTNVSKSYNCYSKYTVNRIKSALVKIIVRKLIKLLEDNTCRGISEYIVGHTRKERALNDFFPDLKKDISSAVYGGMAPVLRPLYSDQFISLPGLILDFVQIIAVSIWNPLDVNSTMWRNKVADQIHAEFHDKQKAILSMIWESIQEIFTQTLQDLQMVSRQIDEYKCGIGLSDQHALIDKWKAIGAISDLLKTKYPSVLTILAGEKDGAPFLKVFLRHEDIQVEDFIRDTYGKAKTVKCVYVTKEMKEIAKCARRMVSSKDMTCATRYKLSEIHDIIKRQGEKLMANHSTIVAIGVDWCIESDNPHIVVFCLDKNLIPFGEKRIPSHIENEMIEIRSGLISEYQSVGYRLLYRR